MKNTSHPTWPLAFLTLGLGLAVPVVRAQHINAGAVSTAPGSQLSFANGAGFVASSGFTEMMNYSNSGRFASTYNIGGPSFTALARTTNNGATPSPGAAAAGSFLQLRLETVTSGPAGGVFSFWENAATSPTLSLSVGQTASSGNLIPLSDASLGAGNAGADPFGHLHGRRYTATIEGNYTVGFRIVDTSKNGVAGGPIHPSSDLFVMNFSAVPEPSVTAFIVLGAAGIGFARWRSGRRAAK